MSSFLEFTQTWKNNITQDVSCSAVRSVFDLPEITVDDPTTCNRPGPPLAKVKKRGLPDHALEGLLDNWLEPEEEQILFEG